MSIPLGLIFMMTSFVSAMASDHDLDSDALIASGNFAEAATVLRRELRDDPEHVTRRVLLARVLIWEGEYEDALLEYDSLQKRFPDDVDYMVARAQLYLWLERDDLALESAKKAVDLAPDYEYPWRLLIQVLNRKPVKALDNSELSVYDEAMTRFPDASWWKRPSRILGSGWALTVGAAQQYIDNNLEDWSNQFVSLKSRDYDNSHWFVQIDRDQRFGQIDSTFRFGGRRSLTRNRYVGFELGAGPGASFSPRSAVSLSAGKNLTKGWNAQLGWWQRRYESAIVSTYSGTIERYFDEYRAAYTLNASRLHGETTSLAHILSVNWYYRESNNVGIVVSDGEEAESVAPGQVLESDVMSISVTGRQQLNEQWRLNWWIGVHDQDDFYRRRYVGLALTIFL